MSEYELTPIEKLFYEAALSRMPALLPQQWVGRYRVDFLIPDRHLIIECDGHEFHSSREARTYDSHRERQLQLLGYTVIRFTGTEIYRDLGRCVDEAVSLMSKQPEFAPVDWIGLKFCARMQDVITRLVEKNGIDFDNDDFFLKLEMGSPWLPLSIERHGPIVTVSHYALMGEDLVPDPSMTFAVTRQGSDYEEWVALSLGQIFGSIYAADYRESDDSILLEDESSLEEIATFAEQWARGIRAQGYEGAEVSVTAKESWSREDG